MKKDKIKKNNCSQNPLEIEIENACSCNDKIQKITRVPDEFFYNSCDCINCDCDKQEEKNENGDTDIICSCGYITNPLGLDNEDYSCQCNEINIFH